MESFERPDHTFRGLRFYCVGSEDEVRFGRFPKRDEDISLAEYQSLLGRVGDEEIFFSNTARCDGCRVHRGRITALLLELLDKTLKQYAEMPTPLAARQGCIFIDAVESAVKRLRSLGLAHNDVNSYRKSP